MELTSEISLSTIGELNQKVRKNRKIGILSATFIGASIFMLGFLAFAQSTKINSKIYCSCETGCSCYVNGLK